jgi:hypothetical protein
METLQVKLPEARLSFADIYEAKPDKDGKNPRYASAFLIDPSTKVGKKTLKMLKAGVAELSKKAFKGKKLPADRICIKDGDGYDYDGYEGMYFVRARSKHRPVIVDNKVRPVSSEDDHNAPYSGCYVSAVITLWAQDNEFGRRINASLEAIQFIGHGDKFAGGGGVDAKSVFEAVDVNDDDDDADDDDDDDEAPF